MCSSEVGSKKISIRSIVTITNCAKKWRCTDKIRCNEHAVLLAISSDLSLRRGAIVLANETPRSSIPSPRSIFALFICLSAPSTGFPLSLLPSFSLSSSSLFSLRLSVRFSARRSSLRRFLVYLASSSVSLSFSAAPLLENRYLKQLDFASFL